MRSQASPALCTCVQAGARGGRTGRCPGSHALKPLAPDGSDRLQATTSHRSATHHAKLGTRHHAKPPAPLRRGLSDLPPGVAFNLTFPEEDDFQPSYHPHVPCHASACGSELSSRQIVTDLDSLLDLLPLAVADQLRQLLSQPHDEAGSSEHVHEEGTAEEGSGSDAPDATARSPSPAGDAGSAAACTGDAQGGGEINRMEGGEAPLLAASANGDEPQQAGLLHPHADPEGDDSHVSDHVVVNLVVDEGNAEVAVEIASPMNTEPHAADVSTLRLAVDEDKVQVAVEISSQAGTPASATERSDAAGAAHAQAPHHDSPANADVAPGHASTAAIGDADDDVEAASPGDANAQQSGSNPGAKLVEIVADLGRPPLLRFDDDSEQVLDVEFSMGEALQRIAGTLQEEVGPSGTAAEMFGSESRVGVPGTLHLVSALCNKGGKVTGLTYSVGRHVAGGCNNVDFRAWLASLSSVGR